MDWASATSLDQLWRSQVFPMWLTLAAAGFFAIITFLILVRAEKSVANGALTVITLLAIGVAVAAAIRDTRPDSGQTLASKNLIPPVNAAMPALSCIDAIAGEVVEEACERALFGTPDAAAAAVSYAASEISRLISFGDVEAANKVMSPELQALRRAVERDRYGLVAHVLVVRDHCQPSNCAAFQSLSDHNQVAANMEERTYERLIARYALSWGAPAATADAAGVRGTPSMPAPGSVPTGRPTTIDLPTSESIPPVSIMTPEPSTGATPPAPASASAQTVPKPRPSSARKSPPKAHVAAPVRLTPEPSSANTQN